MKLTEKQLHELQQIIEDHHAAFVANNIAPGAVPAETLQRLKDKGLVNVRAKASSDAYSLGMLAAHLESEPDLTSLSYKELKSRLLKDPIPLGPVEHQALQNAQLSAGQYIRGIGVRMSQYAGSRVMQTDAEARAALQAGVRTETEAAIANRKSVGEMVTDLGHATLDFTRDMRRVANTEMASAMAQGQADTIAARDGTEAQVAFLSAANCCPQCEELYNEDGGSPRIFKLSDVQANGTNVGRKKDDWLPVIPPCHPNCRCQCQAVPAGWGFDDDRMLVPPSLVGKKTEQP